MILVTPARTNLWCSKENSTTCTQKRGLWTSDSARQSSPAVAATDPVAENRFQVLKKSWLRLAAQRDLTDGDKRIVGHIRALRGRCAPAHSMLDYKHQKGVSAGPEGRMHRPGCECKPGPLRSLPRPMWDMMTWGLNPRPLALKTRASTA